MCLILYFYCTTQVHSVPDIVLDLRDTMVRKNRCFPCSHGANDLDLIRREVFMK